MSEESPQGDGLSVFGPNVRGRSCGKCQACCFMLAVPGYGLDKPAATRCQHQRAKGCGIYEDRPFPCRVFSCRWLFDADTAGMRRPDLAGYVLDPALDTAFLGDQPFDMLQVWVDSARPDAHRDPALRAYLAMMAERYRLPAIVRWEPARGMMLWAPCLTDTGAWIERVGDQVSREQLEARPGYPGASRYRATFESGPA